MSSSATTDSGRVLGTIENDVTVFRGIPYAAAPVGELRFAPPAPVTPWDGEHPALVFGPSSLQNVDPLSMTIPGAERYYYSPRSARFSEDCLFLNITTPRLDDARRPVIVWIHGGAFVTGSGSGEWFDGTNLATEHDVVVVTINYRLGILGNLYLGDIDPSATNMGLRDQIAALEWLQRNIAAFGGDPGNVTIAGHSAGAMSVAALLASPPAVGLFHRAIIQSGHLGHFADTQTATEIAQGVFDALHLRHGNTIEQLRQVSTVRLLEVQRTLGLRMSPVKDGAVLPIDPLSAVRAGHGVDVPLLIGNTAAENKLFHFTGWPVPAPGFDLETALERFVTPRSSAIAAEGARLYRTSESGSDAHLWDIATTDAGWVLPSRQLADAHSAAGRPTFNFDFAFESTAEDGALGAAHEVDVPFVFDALDKPGVDELLGSDAVGDDATRALAAQVSTTWAAFARDGIPTLTSIPTWPRYYEHRRATVVLDRVSTVSADHNGRRLDFWQEHAPDNPLAVLFTTEL